MSRTTERGFTNRNGQINLGCTTRPGNDNNQYIYVMHCSDCEKNYGANGSDIFQRKCPYHQGGRQGLELIGDEPNWRLSP